MKENTIIDNETLKRTIRRLAYEIIEKNPNIEEVVLLGIRHKGVRLAEVLQDNIKQIEGVSVPMFELDIVSYRDDNDIEVDHQSNKENVLMDITEKVVVLVDDVFYTGRTIRAALDACIDLGRPSKIELAVLVDRGHRQLPIRANYVGKNIATSKTERVQVVLTDLAGTDHVKIIKE